MSESGMNFAGINVNQAGQEMDEARKKKYRQEWEQTGGGQLCLAFYDAFKKYKDYLEIHDGETLRPSGPISNKYDEHTVFQECLSTLEATNENGKRRCGGTWKRRSKQRDASMNF